MSTTNVSMPYVPGPCQVYVTLNNGNGGANWLYLGQSRDGVRVSISPEWQDVFVDGSGPMVPFDRQFQGEVGSISMDLIFFKESVLAGLKSWLNDGSAPGQGANGCIGTLARTEGYQYQMILVPLYASKAIFANNGTPQVYYFHWVVPVGSWEVLLSPTVKAERISFDAQPVMNNLGGYTLYETTTSITLPAPN